MSLLSRSPWLRRTGAALVTAVGLGALAAATQPAEARVWVGVNFGGPWGYAPYYYRPYHPYRAYYGYPVYHPGWGAGGGAGVGTIPIAATGSITPSRPRGNKTAVAQQWATAVSISIC